MNLVLFTHPDFLGSQSMPRFARSLGKAFADLGHQVTMLAPRARVRRLASNGPLAKWAGYLDQYLLFPSEIKSRLLSDPADTFYVFCDQALGPWVPYVAHRPHVVHCHDLLALRSALGLIPENPTRPSGRLYQRYIRAGYRKARHFISVSNQTRAELHEFGDVEPVTSEVVYNGMNFPYGPMPLDQATAVLHRAGLAASVQGLLLHVSGAQWYKNVAGVLRMYAHYARRHSDPLPLWLVGVSAQAAQRSGLDDMPPQGQVKLLRGIDNITLQALYSLSRVLLFPSLAEGFGWPIVEAQACGCPVITTAEAPMTEVGGPHGSYLPLLRAGDDVQAWAAQGASVLDALLALPQPAREHLSLQCVEWSRRFDADSAIDAYLKVYRRVLDWERARAGGPAQAGGR